jgi:hypothetical protein
MRLAQRRPWGLSIFRLREASSSVFRAVRPVVAACDAGSGNPTQFYRPKLPKRGDGLFYEVLPFCKPIRSLLHHDVRRR